MVRFAGSLLHKGNRPPEWYGWFCIVLYSKRVTRLVLGIGDDVVWNSMIGLYSIVK